jgi:muramoyltetrapeptide carboxypeptidase
LGLKAKLGKHFYDRYGYLGRQSERADVNAALPTTQCKLLFLLDGQVSCGLIFANS